MTATNVNFTSYPFHARRITHLDHLNIKDSDKVYELLGKYGDNYPDPERVEYTTKLKKINKRGKKQLRVFILTTKALYNVKPNSINTLQRRIDIKDIASVTSSMTSLEFVINIPTQYDYRYQATDHSQKNEIIRILCTTYHRISHRHLNIHKIAQSSTVAYTVNRNVAQLTSREQRHNRKRALMDRCVDLQTTQRIQNLPSKLHDSLLTNGYLRDEVVNEMCLFVPDIVYSLVFKYFYISFSFKHFKIIKCIVHNGVFPMRLLKIERNNTYKRGRKYFLMKIVWKKDIINNRYNTLKVMENKRLLESIGYHPYIQSLCYAFQTKKRLFTVCEYCDGVKLLFVLKKHEYFNEAICKILIAQISLAIGHLHKFDIFNIDLTASNIIIDQDGYIKLTDILPLNFNQINGNNIQIPSNTAKTMDINIEYSAPELIVKFNNQQMITKAVDWWGVGILIYQFGTGKTPFYATNINEMYNKIKSAPLIFPRKYKFSKEFQDVTMKLLKRDILNRLGAESLGDIKDIMRHPFFSDIHWFNLKKKETSFSELNTLNISNIFPSFAQLKHGDKAKDMIHIIKDDEFSIDKNNAFTNFTSFP